MTNPKTILVIDDDTDIHDFCRAVLGKAGYTVEVAFSGVEGRQKMSAAPADLVILDVMMEEADAGFETAKWLAAKEPAVPVLMLSSIAGAADGLFDTTSLKVADLVNKPIAPQELLAKVAGLLAKRA